MGFLNKLRKKDNKQDNTSSVATDNQKDTNYERNTDVNDKDYREIERYRKTRQINCPRGDCVFDRNDSTCTQCTYLLVCMMKKDGF
jgi:hypothetical protein